MALSATASAAMTFSDAGLSSNRRIATADNTTVNGTQKKPRSFMSDTFKVFEAARNLLSFTPGASPSSPRPVRGIEGGRAELQARREPDRVAKNPKMPSQVASSTTPVFVYGTLMYPPVLNLLLKRVPTLTPATVKGFRRCRVLNQPYPAVVIDATTSVDGLLLSGLLADEIETLHDYEGEEYVLHTGVEAVTKEGRTTCALYLWDTDAYADRLVCPSEPWDEQAFVDRDLDAFVAMLKVGGDELRPPRARPDSHSRFARSLTCTFDRLLVRSFARATTALPRITRRIETCPGQTQIFQTSRGCSGAPRRPARSRSAAGARTEPG